MLRIVKIIKLFKMQTIRARPEMLRNASEQFSTGTKMAFIILQTGGIWHRSAGLQIT